MTRYGLAIGIMICVLMVGGDLQAREWTDNTGAFRIEAELVGVVGSKVRLKKPDGQEIEVPLNRLSSTDQRHLHSVQERGDESRKRIPKGSIVERIERALQAPATAEFLETPLADVVAYLINYAEVPMRLDQRALDDVGLSTDVPVTANVKNIKLAVLLDGMLDPLGLTWGVRDEVILITTPEEAESHLEPRVYRLQKPVNLDQLLGDVTQNIEPDSWAAVGGPGSIQTLPPNLLVIAQADLVQREIAEHYADILQPIPSAEQFPIPGPAGPQVKAALMKPAQIDCIETWLQDVVDQLQKQHRVPIQLDARSLKDIGLGTDVPITESLNGVQLRHALNFLCRSLDLTWLAGKEGILITTPEAAESRLELVSFRINDLVPPQGADALIRVVTSTVAPASWDHVGGPGSLRLGVRGTLDVRQTFGTQMEISRLLEDIRSGRQSRR